MAAMRFMKGTCVTASILALSLGAQDVNIFRIRPTRPVEELRAEAAKAEPPVEQGEFLPPGLVDVITLDPSIKLDIRYATQDNFLSTAVYTEPRALLQRAAAEALVRAHQVLKQQGFGLLIHDAYRPWQVTWIFWEATPPDKRDYVADPRRGSRHNRGCAVDLTLFDLKTGRAVEMPSLYDEMSERAWPDFTGGTAESRRLRDVLRDAMEREGYMVYEYEWWHYDYKDWRRYRIGTQAFEAIGR